MIGAVVSGTLVGDPVERQTRERKPFVTATARVAAGEDAIFIGLAAFNETSAERLLQMRAGGAVSACGVLEQTHWTAKDGTARNGWRLTAYAATKKRRSAEGSEE